MPVTIAVTPEKVGRNRDPVVSVHDPPATLYLRTRKGCEDPYRDDPEKPADAQPALLGSSFRSQAAAAATSFAGAAAAALPEHIVPYDNGFVRGVLRAFNQDLHLTIRPEDVWLAILVQFNFYVNGNAEALRDVFVAHEGKKTLTVDLTPLGLDFDSMGDVAQTFTKLIEQNVVDQGLREWMMPSFTTTTDHDRSVAAFVMMGSMKSYFAYSVMIGCGFPSVTLLGERQDWADLAARVERLPRYGHEAAAWAELLRPVTRGFVRAFDAPPPPGGDDPDDVRDFWLRAVHEEGSEGSGMGVRTLSGWLTAFAFWDEDGRRVHALSDKDVADREGRRYGNNNRPRQRLVLDGVTFPLISHMAIAKGVMTVPIKLRDYGIGKDRYTTALAGSVGMALSDSASKVQPVTAWWLVEEFQKPISEPATGMSQAGSTVGGSTTDGHLSLSESDDGIM